MLGSKQHISYKALPDDEGIDRIELAIEPRYKTSGMSGDEWRVSTVVRFFRKGELLWETSFGKMEYAVAFLGAEFHSRSEKSPRALWDYGDGLCMQPPCADPVHTEYRIKEEYSSQGDGPLPGMKGFEKRRSFCLRHAQRGDSDREDCDTNYEVLSGPGPRGADVHDEDESPAAQLHVPVSSIDEVPGAVDAAMKKFRNEQ